MSARIHERGQGIPGKYLIGRGCVFKYLPYLSIIRRSVRDENIARAWVYR